MHNTFTRLGFEYTFDGEVFTVQAPSHRFDIEIEEDLIEEVARLYGYEKLPDRPPLARIAMKSPKEASRTGHALRREMAVLGYQELINFSFVPEAWEKDFAGNDAPIRLLNPIASQLSVMRTQLVGGLVDILKYNLNRKAERVRVFELGRVFFPDPAVLDGPWSVKGVRQPSHIAGLAYGTASDVQWGVEARRVDFYDVKGDVERLVAHAADGLDVLARGKLGHDAAVEPVQGDLRRDAVGQDGSSVLHDGDGSLVAGGFHGEDLHSNSFLRMRASSFGCW